MMDKTASQRMVRLRARKLLQGITAVTLMVPVSRAEELKAIAARMVMEAEREAAAPAP
jgi:hypothetical protein